MYLEFKNIYIKLY